jgi:hypothetical protein
MRLVCGTHALRRVSPQRHEMIDAHGLEFACHGIDRRLVRSDAGQVRGGGELGLVADPGDRVQCRLLGRAARTIGHRHEIRLERRKPRDAFPQLALHVAVLGRKELEGHLDAFGKSFCAGAEGAGHVRQFLCWKKVCRRQSAGAGREPARWSPSALGWRRNRVEGRRSSRRSARPAQAIRQPGHG